ncbi:MAG: nucleoside triphosphate pyrophosphohydrolase family protein [Lachnospiraceae bacterium]|nr:nucleoside triphosphate pyrophosphohydrolase family protein [Lachnospiraceae bacterium]
MELNEYQKLAMRTDSNHKDWMDRLLNGLMGLNGEAGEAIDVLKKHLYQGHEFDEDKMVEEIGDVLWYCALCADALGYSLEFVATYNIEKLKKRYPEGFTAEDSMERRDHDKDG